MALFKRGDTYHYEFVRNGNRYRGTTGTGNIRDARDIETARKNELARGAAGLPRRQAVPLLRQFITDSFLPSILNAKPRTKVFYEHHAKVLLKSSLANFPLDGLNGAMIEKFAFERRHKVSKRGKMFSPASVNRDLAVLRRILNYAIEEGKIQAAPRIKLKLKDEPRRERIVTPADEALYLAAAAPLLHDVATLLFDLGLRPDECFRLTRANFRDGFCTIFQGKAAGSRRQIPCSDRVLEIVRSRAEGEGNSHTPIFWTLTKFMQQRPIDGSSIKKQHRAALKKSGVEPFVLYSIRHTAITRWSKRVSPLELKHIAGHKSLATTERYTHDIDQQRLRDAVLGAAAQPTQT